VSDWSLRRKAHEILQQLMDKNQLHAKIKQLKPNLFLTSSTTAGSIVTIMNKSTSNMNDLNQSNASLNRLSMGIDSGGGDKAGGESSDQIKTRKNQSQSATSLSKTNTRNQTYLSQLDLSADSSVKLNAASREDTQFMRKYGRIFLAHLNETLFLANNRRENFESLYMTASLFLIGLYNEKEFLVDLVRFGFHVQELALLNYEQAQFSLQLQCCVHKFVCAFFLLLSKSSGLKEFYNYCSDICDWRRKKDLFRFVYPEYLLLDAALPADSGIQSNHGSLPEIETEFKRELTNSAKEYSNAIKRQLQTLNENEEIAASDPRKMSASQRSLAASTSNLAAIKQAPWLFSKQVIGDILKNAGISTTNLFQQSSDYSLSVGYLQQTMLPIQTVLKFRSPYSNSYESLVALTQADLNQNSLNRGSSGLNNHHGGIDHSTSGTNFGNQHKRAYR
jgi:hypothetical protein